MRCSNEGIELIKSFEAFSPTVYICSGGYPTLGYGHVITESERDKFAKGISDEEAEDLLKRDLQKTERAITRLVKVPLTQNQFDALCSFTFNVGSGALQRSTLRMKINREEFEEAADEFLKWIWAGGKKLRGLIRRRQAERQVFLTV